VEIAVEDMVYLAEKMWAAGAEGINFDTAGAGGDADFLATLLAVERLRAGHPGMGMVVGMPVAHAVASGMDGSRAAVDLVARLEKARA